MLRLTAMAMAALLLAACVRSEISSYTDPSFRQSAAVGSVVVFGLGMGLEERATVEGAAVARLGARGIRGVRGLDVAPPTRTMNDAEIVDAILASGADGVLIIGATAKGETSSYVPPQYHPGSVYGTATTTGNFTTFNIYQSPGYTTGGYTITKPNAQYAAVLYDADTGAQLWQAGIQSRGTAFDDYESVAEGMAGDVIDELVESGLASATVTRPAQTQSASSSFGSRPIDTKPAAGYAPGRTEAEPFADAPGYAEIKEVQALYERDPRQGQRRLLTIAERGNPLAMLAVAVSYVDGRGVLQDCELARHWLERSAHSISGWNATGEDQAELRAIVALFRSDPEMGISRVCPE